MERERERGRERESVSFQKGGSVNSRPWTESARVTTPVVTAGRREKSRQYPGEGNLSRGVSALRIAVGIGRKEGRDWKNCGAEGGKESGRFKMFYARAYACVTSWRIVTFRLNRPRSGLIIRFFSFFSFFMANSG